MKNNRLFIFFPLLLLFPGIGNIQKIVEENKGATVYSSTQTNSEGGTVKSTVSTTVNGENITVQTNQSGSVEVNNINGKVEIKTSKGITPTIFITGTPVTVQEIVSVSDKSQEETETQNIFKNIFSPARNIFRNFFNLFKGKNNDLTKRMFLF